MKRCRFVSVVLFSTIFGSHASRAEPIKVECEKENVLSGTWLGPLKVTYSGGLQGEITITSEHLSQTFPANLTENTGVVDGREVSSTAIRGAVDIQTVMPDPKALIECARANIQPEFQDDADMQTVEIANCVSKTTMAPTPINISLNVALGLIPTKDAKAPDVIVEMRRRYVDVVTPLGKDIIIETYPKNCKLSSQ